MFLFTVFGLLELGLWAVTDAGCGVMVYSPGTGGQCFGAVSLCVVVYCESGSGASLDAQDISGAGLA